MLTQQDLDAEQAAIAKMEEDYNHNLRAAKDQLDLDKRAFDKAQVHVSEWTTLVDALRVYGDEASNLALAAFERIKAHL